MGSVVIFDVVHEFSSPRDAYPERAQRIIPSAELDGTRVRYHHPGGPDSLQLFELDMDPGLELAPHAHEADEIIAIVAGELHVGRRVLGPGTSIFVPGGTLYSVTAGAEGCRFLNFRARSDMTYFGPEEWRALNGSADRSGDA